MTTQLTVGEIAKATPAAVRVFEKYQIDYCCGGKRPLEEVCQERGVSAETLLAEVEEAAGRENGTSRDWSRASLTELIRHILTTHHEYLKAELPVMRARLDKVVEAHGEKYPETLPPLQSVFLGLFHEIQDHTRKEEMILFPAIGELEAARQEGRPAYPPPFGTVRNPIRMMVFEHDNAGQALKDMRSLTQDYTLPPDACATWHALYHELARLEADLHQHIHLENNILFPRAAELE